MLSIYRTVGIAIIIVLSIHLFSEPLYCDETTGGMGLKPDYYTLGFSTAQTEYHATEPFGTGLMIGMVLPFATGASAKYIHQTVNLSRSLGVAGGVTVFALSCWGGYKLTKQYPTPSPDSHMAGLSTDARDSFRKGYNTFIRKKRYNNYQFGVIIGPIIDLVIFIVLCSHLDLSDT